MDECLGLEGEEVVDKERWGETEDEIEAFVQCGKCGQMHVWGMGAGYMILV